MKITIMVWMPTPLKTAALGGFLLSGVFLSAIASDGETGLLFRDLPYPLSIKLSGGENPGTVLFESAFSEPPARDYDTVLLQGEMPDPGISLELLIKPDPVSGNWVRYKQLAFRRFPSGRFWAKYSTGSRTRQPLKIRVINAGLRTDCVLTIYTAELLKKPAFRGEEGVQAATVPYVPEAAFYLPSVLPFKVIRRSVWQAAAPNQPYLPHTPLYFTLHHTQAHYPKTYEESISEIQFIQDYHQNAQDWIDIGYHFLIDPLGNIFEGRPINAVGAHVKYFNTGNVGISIMGDYHPPASNPATGETLNAFVTVGRYLKDAYSIDVSSFYAHRDLGATDCPGDGLYSKKETLRGLIFAPQPPPPPVDGVIARMNPVQSESLRQLVDYLENNQNGRK